MLIATKRNHTNDLVVAIVEYKLSHPGRCIVMLKQCKCFYFCLSDIGVLTDAAWNDKSILLTKPILQPSHCITRHHRIMPHRLKLVELDQGDIVLSDLA